MARMLRPYMGNIFLGNLLSSFFARDASLVCSLAIDFMSRSSALRYYIFMRLLLAPLMLWVITSVVFLLLRATPGDPVDVILGPRAPESAKVALRLQLGLADPLWRQYLHYLHQ